MSEEEYSELHDLLGRECNPWRHPQMWGQPGLTKARWRKTVKEWATALREVKHRHEASEDFA